MDSGCDADRGEKAPRYTLSLADSAEEILEAQRLRHRVFLAGGDSGARLPRVSAGGIEADAFDRYCEHLIVREIEFGAVVGTYRVLPPAGARAAGGLYSETEFDLRGLDSILAGAVEIGRACVDPAHRGGEVISLLWTGLQDYLLSGRFRHALGCASVPAAPPERAAALARALLARHRGSFDATPLNPFDYERYHLALRAPIPALLRSYLRLGASICGPPAFDPLFATVDFLVVLPLQSASFRHAERIIRKRRAA